MASKNVGVASGADFDAQNARRRNVPSSSPSSGLVNRVEVDEKKTQIKKVSDVETVHFKTVEGGG